MAFWKFVGILGKLCRQRSATIPQVNSETCLGQVASPIASHIRLENCRFGGSFVASSIVSLTGSLSCLNCELGVVGLSNVEFDGPLSMVGCRFTGDTRFIDTHSRAG